MTPNYLKFAISVAFVRPYPDKSHNLHSNGELNQRQISSHLRYVYIVDSERTIEACIQYLPSVKGL